MRRSPILVWVALFLTVLAPVGPDAALRAAPPVEPEAQPVQPPDEVAALRSRIADLERELKAARARIADLEAQLAQAGRRDKDETDAGETAPGEGIGSPDSLLAELKTEYAAAFPDAPPADERGRRQYLRLMSQWSNKVNREYRRRIDWPCRIMSRDLIDADEAYVDLVVIDPATGEPVGSRFVIEWPRRLRSALARFENGDEVHLRGLLEPEVRTNESRAEPGAFDIPPLIGPYAEFRFNVQVTSISELEPRPNPAGGAPPGRQQDR